MLPIMKNEIRTEEKTMKRFRGINVCEDYTSGDICDDVNMSSRMYPSLCTRRPRSTRTFPGINVTGTGNCEGLIYTYTDASGRMYLNYGNKDYEFTSVTSADAGAKREFAALSDSVMIIPDNIIFTPSTGSFTKICVHQQGTEQTAKNKFALESNNSSLLNSATSWHLGSVLHNALMCRKANYSGNNVFYYFAFDSTLKSGDVVTLKLSVKSDEAGNTEAYRAYRKKMKDGITLKIKEITSVTHNIPGGTATETVALIFDDNTVDTGGYEDVVFEEITVERSMPELRQICAFNNRIWGITDREICCSKLGDASEWNDFSTDSYGTLPYACFSSPAPTEGDFTSVLSFGNYIYAFKENAIHRLYGDTPDEFVLKTVETNGVLREKSNTVAKSDSAVFYCSYDGIYKFDGNSAQRISYCLNESIEYECGRSDGEKYYVLCSENGKKYIYVYDIRRKIWHREDAADGIKAFCRSGNDVFASTDTSLIHINPASDTDTIHNPEWNFTVRFDEKLFEKKGFGKISVRYSLGKEAFFTARAIYDDATRGAICGAKHDEVFDGGGYMHMPVKRCRSFKIQFRGKGFFCLKSLRFQYYRGSEI